MKCKREWHLIQTYNVLKPSHSALAAVHCMLLQQHLANYSQSSSALCDIHILEWLVLVVS